MYRSPEGFTATFEGTQAEIFEDIASFREVFEGNYVEDPETGEVYRDVRFLVRQVGKHKYYEKVCLDDGPAKFRKIAFGVHDNDKFTLFPKRRDKEGNEIGWNGWGKWNKKTEQVE